MKRRLLSLSILLALPVSLLGYSTQSLAKKVNDKSIEVITVKGEQLQLDRDDIDRTRGNANADIFSTFTGIEANNIRNEAGALDIGIRGVQGEGRVPIFIDGSLQSTHTNRGYMGTSDRTYIDSDLISTVNIEKGASAKVSPFGSGAIGGTVNISTLNPHDVLKNGEPLGALVKLKTYNNNAMPTVSDDATQQNYYRVDNSHNSSDFENGSIMLATAYKSDNFSAVFAFSDKKTGNYFAGSNGFEKFIETQSSSWGTWEILPPVNPGAEVVNTSFESESYLAKFSYDLNDEHTLEVNTRHHQQKAGEMLASYWYKFEAGDYIQSPDGEWQTLPEGEEAMPQWQQGTAHVNSVSAVYHYLPTNNSFVDVKVNVWKTHAKLHQYNGLASNYGRSALQYLHQYSNTRHGFSAYNVASFKLNPHTPVILTTGYSWQAEKLAPKPGYESTFHTKLPTSRDGKRTANSMFANTQVDLNQLELVFNANLHDAKITDNQTHLTQHFDLKTDLTAQLHYHVLSNTVLKAKYSQAYRMPSLYEGTVSNEVFSYSPEHPIEPEKTNSYEIGLESTFAALLNENDTLTMTANYFHTKIDSMLATANMPKTEHNTHSWQRTYSFTNYDSFTLPGMEFKLNYQSPYLYASASMINYQDVEMCSNKLADIGEAERCNSEGFLGSLTPLRIPPEKSYVATLGTRLFEGDVDTGFIYKKHSEKHHPGGFLSGTGVDALEFIPAGYQLDFYIDYTLSESLSGYAAITNLTDQYKVSTGSVVAMPEPGKTITLGVEIKL
ncbi:MULTISPECIES: TonB-dependent receptor plug domain-containing protein [Pseudoalteromonas]|uniref:TonB-dependent receptor plug domain-containing protein n=1 Tax=Pseudoalteromonas TaxID=53246 RepID=UPI000826B5C6|nr:MULTISPECIES: TonB-dependent receptor plug domain-containing protein [Pseudoalteromonas]